MALRTISSSSTSRMRPGWVASRINLAIIARRSLYGMVHTTCRAKKKSFPRLQFAEGSHFTARRNSDEKEFGPSHCREQKKTQTSAGALAGAVADFGLEGSAG